MQKKIFKGEIRAEFKDKESDEMFKTGMVALLKILGVLFLLFCVWWMIYRPSWRHATIGIRVKDPFSGFEYCVGEEVAYVEALVHSGPVKDGYLKLPESFWGKPVRRVSLWVDPRYEVETVEIPDSVTTIASVSGSGIREVIGGENVNYMYGEAFKGCQNLTRVELDGFVTEVGMSAFEGCQNLKEVKLGNSIEAIQKYAFKDCTSLEKIELGYGVERIGVYAFSGCTSLAEVEQTSGLDEIGVGAFEGTPWAETEEGKAIIEAYEEKDD